MRRVVKQVKSKAAKQSRIHPEVSVSAVRENALCDEVEGLLERINALIG